MGDIQSLLNESEVGDKISAGRVPTSSIRQVLYSLLSQCDVSYIVKPYDQPLHDSCVALCKERGYPIETPYIPGPTDSVNAINTAPEPEPSLLPFLATGVYMSSLGCAHLASDLPRLTYIAVYTTFVAYLDDQFTRHVEKVASFGKRLMRGEEHGHPVLDGLAHLLATDTEGLFGCTQANMIVHDTLGFLNSLLLDYETQGLKWSPDATGYPHFKRLMSGIPTAYTMFIFPADMPIANYIQSLPEIRDYVCYLNDVMSFYKEEVRDEADNYISLVSTAQGAAKSAVFAKLAEDVARTTAQIDKMLVGDPEALNAWTTFKAGYIYFHFSDARYRLEELELV